MISKALPSFFHFSGVITPLALDLGPPIGECGTVEVYCNNECSFQYMIAEKLPFKAGISLCDSSSMPA